MKIANQNAREYVQNKEEFQGSNLAGKQIGDLYIVYSYEWYPIFIFNGKLWYENADGFSLSTKRQIKLCRPTGEIIKLSRIAMRDLAQQIIEAA